MFAFESLLSLEKLRNIVVNIVGQPGSGKSTICYNYAAEVLNSGQSVVFVSLIRPPEQIISRINGLTNINDSTSNNLLTVVDGYSPVVGLKSRMKLSFNAGNLSDFTIALRKALELKPEAVFIDSLSSLSIFNEETAVTRAVHIAIAKMREYANHCFIAYEDGIHSETFYNTIRFLGDITLVLRQGETKDGDAVRSMHIQTSQIKNLDQRWRFYTIDLLGRIRLQASIFDNPLLGRPNDEIFAQKTVSKNVIKAKVLSATQGLYQVHS